MGWKSRFNAETRIVEIDYVGRVTQQDLMEAFAGSGAVMAENACLHVLADCSGMSNPPAILDIFGLVETISMDLIPPEFKEAVLVRVSDDLLERARFYETACVNRGMNVRVFVDRDEALAWLAAPASSAP